jgi:hypothetical protein
MSPLPQEGGTAVTLDELKAAAHRLLEDGGRVPPGVVRDSVAIAEFALELMRMGERPGDVVLANRLKWAAEFAGAGVACPEHHDTCDGTDAECCCADLHRPWARSTPPPAPRDGGGDTREGAVNRDVWQMPCDAPAREDERRARDAADAVAEWMAELSWSRRLGRNLAAAGALTKAYRLGDLAGWQQAYDDYGYGGWGEDPYQGRETWAPNADGRPAPGTPGER